MTPNEGRVYLSLAGYNFDPNRITELLGVQPTAVNHGGISGSSAKPAISSWALGLETDSATEEVDIYKLTDELIKILEPIKDKIIQAREGLNLSPKFVVELLLSVDKEENSPEVGFRGRSLKFMTEIGALIEIDYKLSQRV